MGRIVKMKVESCVECPFRCRDDGEESFDGDYCKRIGMGVTEESPYVSVVDWKKVKGEGYLGDISHIPDWCPLPGEKRV